MAKDIFKPIVNSDKLDQAFASVMEERCFQAARELINLIYAEYHDIDKSFIREFQTHGFSARVFELALFAYLQENDLHLDRSIAAPDFVVQGRHPVAIEVTTSNPPQNSAKEDTPIEIVPDNLEEKDREFVFQIAKVIRRKLLHTNARGEHYWQMPHVAELPFVLAVQAFHDAHAQFFPMGLIGNYLYGNEPTFHYDDNGQLKIEATAIEEHEYGDRKIPSGLFRQAEAEYLSGVLFTNCHTVNKFNRIGTEMEFGPPDVLLVRTGTCHDRDPNASEPKLFTYLVNERPPEYPETFTEGLHLFINPWAKVPLDPRSFPNVTLHELQDNGTILSSHSGGFEPYISKTIIIESE